MKLASAVLFFVIVASYSWAQTLLTPSYIAFAKDQNRDGTIDSVQTDTVLMGLTATEGFYWGTVDGIGLAQFDLTQIEGSIVSAILQLKPETRGGAGSAVTLMAGIYGFTSDGEPTNSDFLIGSRLGTVILQSSLSAAPFTTVTFDIGDFVTGASEAGATFVGVTLRPEATVDYGYSIFSSFTPSLVVTTAAIPEPSNIGLMLGALSSAAVFVVRRKWSSRFRGGC